MFARNMDHEDAKDVNPSITVVKNMQIKIGKDILFVIVIYI